MKAALRFSLVAAAALAVVGLATSPGNAQAYRRPLPPPPPVIRPVVAPVTTFRPVGNTMVTRQVATLNPGTISPYYTPPWTRVQSNTVNLPGRNVTTTVNTTYNPWLNQYQQSTTQVTNTANGTFRTGTPALSYPTPAGSTLYRTNQVVVNSGYPYVTPVVTPYPVPVPVPVTDPYNPYSPYNPYAPVNPYAPLAP